MADSKKVIAYCVLALAFFVVSWLSFSAIRSNSKSIRSNRAALKQIKHDRKERVRLAAQSDYKLCVATNRVYRINNNDRELLIESRKQTLAAIPKSTGILRELLAGSINQFNAAIRVRPHLTLIKCKALPSQKKER